MTPQALRDARQTLGLTQPEFAKAIGVSRTMTVSNWERGVNPVPETVAILVRLLVNGVGE